MSVKLVWITPDAEKTIAYCGRVSSNYQDNPNIVGLLKYLVNNKHWSPFEMASCCIEITTTRAISAQLLRHRSFSFQEFSQRYSPVKALCIPELRTEHSTNRQSSSVIHDKSDKYREQIVELYTSINDLYKQMTKDGVARETARMILPLSTQTRLYMCGTIRSWIHYLEIRTEEHTQKEHREIAEQIRLLLNTQLPTVFQSLLIKNDL